MFGESRTCSLKRERLRTNGTHQHFHKEATSSQIFGGPIVSQTAPVFKNDVHGQIQCLCRRTWANQTTRLKNIRIHECRFFWTRESEETEIISACYRRRLPKQNPTPINIFQVDLEESRESKLAECSVQYVARAAQARALNVHLTTTGQERGTKKNWAQRKTEQ